MATNEMTESGLDSLQTARGEIWEGDKLGRQAEADMIEAYIRHQALRYKKQQREQAIVIAIDAAYGEGKSFFIDRLALQLELTHPVARIDAWADDAGGEPLIAFMGAIDEALAPT